MAKSARASVKKTNKTKLRARVFKPIENARAERLSAKLMALASQPKPERDEEMQLDTDTAVPMHSQKLASTSTVDNDIDMDDDTGTGSEPKSKSRSKKSARVQKKRRGKPASLITFPAYNKGRKASSRDKTKKKKK